jgi:CRISPR system Cascade subunit CasE
VRPVVQGVTAGFHVRRVEVVAYRTEQIPRRRQRPIEFGLLDLTREISVERPELFLPALAKGFGKGKAFGCGLMLIRRSQ